MITGTNIFAFNHASAKTLRGSLRESNMFVVRRCAEEDWNTEFFSGYRNLGVDLSYVNLLRILSEDALVLNQPVTYSVKCD